MSKHESIANISQWPVSASSLATRSSAGITTMSRLATQQTVQATACSISTKSSSPSLIQTTGLAAPLPRTPPEAAAPWVRTPLSTPMLRASGTATLLHPTPNSDKPHLYIILTSLFITKPASSPTPHGDGLDEPHAYPGVFVFAAFQRVPLYGFTQTA
jgi:hypothetical protein